MDQKTINVLLTEDSPDYAELVQLWLTDAGEAGAFVLSWTDSLAASLNRLAQGAVDVVLLDLGLPDSDGVETFRAVRAHAPGIPVIILSAADSESLALQMIQEGAEDYVVKSTCTPERLVRTLRYAVIRRTLQRDLAGPCAASERARVIGVLGAKGGVGTTTVACNLALALRHQTGKEVLLADLDVNAGLVSFLMGLEPRYSMMDAIVNVDRLDRDCWNSIVANGTSGLQIITCPNMPGSPELPAESLRRVFNLVRTFYQWIVIDFGRLNRVWQSLADGVDELLLVTTTALPALHEAKRVIDVLVSGNMDLERLRLIVNRTEDVQGWSGSELEQVFGIQVYATVSNERQELHVACLHKGLSAESSNIGRQMADLARKVAGLRKTGVKRNLPGVSSLVERFRRKPAQEREPIDSRC